MKIRKVIIENFRCYKERTEIDIDDLTVFVGANDSGKSAVLEALDVFFYEGKGEVKLSSEDININAYSAEDEPVISISVVFENVPKRLIEILVTNGIELVDSSIEITKVFRFANRLSTSTYLYGNEIQRNLKKEIVNHFPIYALFKVDRTNTDDNPEVRDPLKFTVEKVLKQEEIRAKLEEVANKVKESVYEVAIETLNTLNRFNTKVARELKPNIPEIDELKWIEVFKKIGLKSDNNIPLNKRGSGVRRLVLLSFFIAEAKRKTGNIDHTKTENLNIIYAVEEPETSLHPDQQRQLIKSLIDLSENDDTQVLLTTHSPYIAQLVPVDSLRFVDKDVEYNSSKVESGKENERILLDIAERLGIHPIISKIVICVEGKTDKQFLLNINKHIGELNKLIDIDSEFIAIIPMHGSNLKEWINQHYLKGSGIIEFHLYDRDVEDYKKEIENVNSRGDGSIGMLTRMREIENYIHWDLIEEEFGIEIPQDIKDNWAEVDVPKWIADKVNKNENCIKSILCGKLSKKLTKEHLEDLGVWSEVKGWFETIAELAKKAIPQGDISNAK